MPTLWMWVAFNAFVLAMLAVDLFFHRKAHTVRVREALAWSIFWIVLSLCFNALIYTTRGKDAALEFLTAYLLEKALSVDNIFVFVLIFSYFKVPSQYQHRVLFWGVLGALVMRGAMIGAGTYLIHEFHWVIYVFGVFLIITGMKMALQGDVELDPGANPMIRLVRKFIPVTNEYHGQKFFAYEPVGKGITGAMRRVATPLFVVLVLVETTDLVFAVDSIPAVFAVTTDTFIVYTSNIFAIMGLRQLYFLLAGVIHKFHHLKLGLSIVLMFVGVKMVVSGVYKIPIGLSLGVIAVVLTTSIVASLVFPSKTPHPDAIVPAGPPDLDGPGDVYEDETTPDRSK